MARPLARLSEAIRRKRRNAEALIVHRTPAHGEKLGTVIPGVRAVGVEQFLSES